MSYLKCVVHRVDQPIGAGIKGEGGNADSGYKNAVLYSRSKANRVKKGQEKLYSIGTNFQGGVPKTKKNIANRMSIQIGDKADVLSSSSSIGYAFVYRNNISFVSRCH